MLAAPASLQLLFYSCLVDRRSWSDSNCDYKDVCCEQRVDTMSNPFSLQVTPELMQRVLERNEKKPRKRRPAKEGFAPVSPISPLPTQEKRLPKREPGAQQAPSAGGWPARDPYFPPFGGPQPPFAGLFGGLPIAEPPVEPEDKHSSDIKKELAPVYEAIEQSNQIAEKLQKQGDVDLQKVRDMAKDLQEKQYRAPSHAPSCSNERAKCVECYKQNHANPLLCSKFVQAFVACSRQAQEAFTASLSS